MRILHLLGLGRLPADPDAEPTGGLQRMALELAKAQAEMGHDVWVGGWTPRSWRIIWKGVHLIGFPMLPWRFGRSRRLTIAAERLSLWRLKRRHLFDVVHGHEYAPRGGRRGPISVLHLHNAPFSSPNSAASRPKARAFWSAAGQVHGHIAVSRYVADLVEQSRESAGIRQDSAPPVFVVPNGVDAQRFDPARTRADSAALRHAWGASDGAVVFLYAGAIVPQKGVLHLIRAFLRLSLELGTVRLVLAGAWNLWGGPGAAHLPDAAYDSQVRAALAPAVRDGQAWLLGLVPPSRMAVVYGASDIVVLPSTVMEAFGLAALEGMAAGKPVIASEVGGVPELVDHSCGRLTAAGDEAALVRAMRELACRPDVRAALGRAARERAQRFSLGAAATQLESIYHQLRRDRA